MAIQPITAYTKDTGIDETVFSRTRPAQADNTAGYKVFARKGDSYTFNRQNTAPVTFTARRTNTRALNKTNTNEITQTDRDAQLTANIQRNAGLYLKAGPRQIAEHSLFTSQTQSTNILTNLTNTFGPLFNSHTTSARQSTEDNIRNFASLYSSAGTRLLNTGALFSDFSVFSNTSIQPTTVTPQITYLGSIQSYLSFSLSNNMLGNGLNFLA